MGPADALPGRRVAIVHPWLVEVRGGEKVFFEMARALPHADLFLLFGRIDRLPSDLRPRLKATTFLQALPKRAYRASLPLLPLAVESLPLHGYDLVLSSASGWTHGVLLDDGALHVSYVHSPPRYLWGTPPPSRAARLAGPLLQPVLHYLRLWDVIAAARVDQFLANSETTAQRIARRYRRSARVLPPPVDVERFLRLEWKPSGYALMVGELVPYKRADRVIAACARVPVPLVIVGDGPERARLERLADGKQVTFAGRVNSAELDRLLAGASVYVHGGVEDFGIATVEAIAVGVPVAGINTGGTAEIGRHGGVALAEPSDEGLAAAIARCLDAPHEYSSKERALRFSSEAFRLSLIERLREALCRKAVST